MKEYNYQTKKELLDLKNKLQKKHKQQLDKLNKIKKQITDVPNYSDPNYVKLLKQKTTLEEWIAQYNESIKLINDSLEALELIADPNTTQELLTLSDEILKENEIKLAQLRENLLSQGQRFDNFILEIRAGAGGEEAALFARDLFRMYTLFFESKGITFEITDVSQTEIGGYKHISAYIKGKGAFEWVKYESGVHRVQRVPVTESGGRIHTSTASVAILPDIDTQDIEVKINPEDLEIERIRASGPGGQFVNKVETAIRIKHKPTGIIVVSQQSKSQTANKEYAMKILRSKLYQLEQEKVRAQLSQTRKSQIGNQDRSEKIRTYNYQQNRVTDHRIKKTWYNLDQIMNGKIEELLLTVKEELDKKEQEANNE